MVKVIMAILFTFMVFLTFVLCRASSMNKDWEAEDEEQARYLADLAGKGK